MIHTSNEEHGQRIMRSIGSDFAKVTMEVISRSENGVLYGGVVFENFTGAGGSILIHVAGFHPTWVNRDMLFITFDYPFNQLGCKYLYGQVACKNKEARAFNKSLGFTEYVTLEGVFPDDDMILVRMKKEDCRFLKLKSRTIRSRRTYDNGQAKSSSTARLYSSS